MNRLDVEERQANNGKKCWCDRCGCKMILKDFGILVGIVLYAMVMMIKE